MSIELNQTDIEDGGQYKRFEDLDFFYYGNAVKNDFMTWDVALSRLLNELGVVSNTAEIVDKIRRKLREYMN